MHFQEKKLKPSAERRNNSSIKNYSHEQDEEIAEEKNTQDAQHIIIISEDEDSCYEDSFNLEEKFLVPQQANNDNTLRKLQRTRETPERYTNEAYLTYC